MPGLPPVVVEFDGKASEETVRSFHQLAENSTKWTYTISESCRIAVKGYGLLAHGVSDVSRALSGLKTALATASILSDAYVRALTIKGFASQLVLALTFSSTLAMATILGRADFTRYAEEISLSMKELAPELFMLFVPRLPWRIPILPGVFDAPGLAWIKKDGYALRDIYAPYGPDIPVPPVLGRYVETISETILIDARGLGPREIAEKIVGELRSRGAIP